jgi:hypothetical protein
VAGHVRLELKNVGAKYPLENSHRFPGIQPNSGRRDYSRSSCFVAETQLCLRGLAQSLRWQELPRFSADPKMIRLRPNLAAPSLPAGIRGRRCEETAARTVRTPAAPELAVGRRLSFAEWHRLVELRPNAGERAVDDYVALAGHHHALFRHDEAIARAAAPFAGGVAMVAAADPGIVCEGVPTHARPQHGCSNQDSHWRRSFADVMAITNGRFLTQKRFTVAV